MVIPFFFFLKAIHHTGISENVCLLIFTINLIIIFEYFVDLNHQLYGNSLFFLPKTHYTIFNREMLYVKQILTIYLL